MGTFVHEVPREGAGKMTRWSKAPKARVHPPLPRTPCLTPDRIMEEIGRAAPGLRIRSIAVSRFGWIAVRITAKDAVLNFNLNRYDWKAWDYFLAQCGDTERKAS
jgi:hypothetical protein